ncbi:hypothetical protein [Nocardia macrotermitis]|uniref:DUF4386 domain-containing protein n=1 Tax=Nocardia macrotermitis TaxID=2585198 RepID=A0A7K0D744_9NOCA|nr:hypothetical protein [Nocardia macrotermitis]MQY21573.1 hypothetical protein [Nocardia macrotermitis]
MNRDTYFRLERISAWTGYLLLVAFVIAFAVGGLLTPMDPNLHPEQVRQFIIDHRGGILLATTIMVLAVPFEYPYVVVTSLQMRRIEGGWGILSMNQLLTGVVAPIGFFFPMAILSAAAWRPEAHSVDTLTALNDIFWLMFVGNACIFVLQVWSIGYAALIDKRPKRVFPRWYGWLSIVLGILLIPGAFVFLTKSGPFAWNGLLANTIPTFAYFVWKIATPTLLLRAVKSEQAEVADGTATVQPIALAG